MLLSWSPHSTTGCPQRKRATTALSLPINHAVSKNFLKDGHIHPTSGALWTRGPRPTPRALHVLYRLRLAQRVRSEIQPLLCSSYTQAESTQNKRRCFPVSTKTKRPSSRPAEASRVREDVPVLQNHVFANCLHSSSSPTPLAPQLAPQASDTTHAPTWAHP